MSWFRKKVRPATWTEQQICLYEKQMAARAALGTKWCCHWTRQVGRTTPSKAQPYIGYDHTAAPAKETPKLRIVK